MPSVSDLSNSNYLQKNDVEPAILVTIDGYDRANLAQDGQPKEMRYVLKFKECKPLVLNKTNGNRIQVALGSDDFDDWIGKQIVLYNDENVEFGGKITGGIRVRAKKKAANNDKPPVGEDTTDYSEEKDDVPF